ncbi:unnamed protein product [Rotaria sp. Silwood1]|nr:unnamed protein product [Rotaria sp. Silwood1]CAF1100311.1 unnamed protein product [Rotaria sp. Silwood1]CAF3469799.1 unnamed protein product [Rotaria sp. Silwood1]CAF4811577.1 unnamed protein product [Rotaria sp. Silwood1]CAF5117231.1 unnamed protein product [Rotaria sp. Silwood1]
MSTDDYLIASVLFLRTQINRHGGLLMMIIGTTGNLLNICVLGERTIRDNPCSIYLWWSSLFSIVFIWSGLITRILEGYDINWPNQTQPVCKARLFILTVCWSVATWALVGASIDRFLGSSESVTYRSLSTIRMARRFLIIIILISILIFGEIFYCYEANVPNVPVPCYINNLTCQLYNNWMNILYNIVIPSGLMAVFGILTIVNVRKRIVHPARSTTIAVGIHRTNRQPRMRKIDRHLRKILLVQVYFK